MRLWHKQLITTLPHQQLLGQWRECCLIAKTIYEDGHPNHILVNPIMDYPPGDFYTYGHMIFVELLNRGYSADFNKFKQWYSRDTLSLINGYTYMGELFYGWHDDIYLRECLYNLEEKYRCKGIPQNEWQLIYDTFSSDRIPLII